MHSKRIRWTVAAIILLVIVTAGLIASQFIGFHNGIFDSAGGSCISIVFDKQAVLGADRIVYKVGDAEITITDPNTVRMIAEKFVVANRAGLCPSTDQKWMYIYNGDKLVRSLQWRACNEIVDIYEADSTHWLYPSECTVGQVEVSDEFLDYLDSLMGSN